MREGEPEKRFCHPKGNPLAWQPQEHRMAAMNIKMFWQEVGKTDGCVACQLGPGGRHHSDVCKRLQQKWRQGKKPEELVFYRDVEIKGRKDRGDMDPQEPTVVFAGIGPGGLSDAGAMPAASAATSAPAMLSASAAATAAPATTTAPPAAAALAAPRGDARMRAPAVARPTGTDVVMAAAPPQQTMAGGSGDGKKRRVALIERIVEVFDLSTKETPYVNERPEPAGHNWDDLIDGLPRDLVEAGDALEMKNMEELAVVEWIREEHIPEDANVITTGWARRLKGSVVRSRCVLRDYAVSKRDDVFSPTPTLTVVRMLLLWSIIWSLTVEAADLISAFMQAPAREVMYARPPAGLREPGWLWRVLKAMNGARTASADFSEFLADVLVNNMGMVRGVMEPCSYRTQQTLRTVIHVDDPIAAGTTTELDTFWGKLEGFVLLRRTGSLSHERPMPYLGREYRRVEDDDNIGFAVKHSAKYFQTCAEVFDLQPTSSVRTTTCKEPKVPNGEDKVDKTGHTRYRSGVGKLQFIKSERTDISFGVKVVAHHMAGPTYKHEAQLKHLMRYVNGSRDEELFLIVRKESIAELRQGNYFVDTFTDTDWAGDLDTRLSTTCALSFIDQFLLESTVMSQDVLANSTAEAEYYGLGSGCRDSLYIRGLCLEFGMPSMDGKELKARIFSDSGNAITLGNRKGPSKKTRHLEVRYHFVQALAETKRVFLNKIMGVKNVADIGTKDHPAETMKNLKLRICIGLEADMARMGPLIDDARKDQRPGQWR